MKMTVCLICNCLSQTGKQMDSIIDALNTLCIPRNPPDSHLVVCRT